jgi:hypothetical protein
MVSGLSLPLFRVPRLSSLDPRELIHYLTQPSEVRYQPFPSAHTIPTGHKVHMPSLPLDKS